MKQDTNILPNYRFENHKIKLLVNKQALFMQNYKSFSEQETDAIKKYIDEHFGKSFIRPSSSAGAAALVLLIKKLGDGLRFYVNYKAFNKITVKNQYLISLINKILEKLSSTVRFSKLDIIYAFNKI